MTSIELKKTPEEQLIRENEILSKIVLELLLKHSNKISKYQLEQRKTDEEITELLNQPDWKEKTQFEVKDYYYNGEYEGECIGHRWAIPWLIPAREPIEIIENLKKEKAVEEKASIDAIAKARYDLMKERVEVKKLNNYKKIVSEIIKEYYTPEENNSNWHEQLIKELEEGKNSDAIINIIRHWKSEAEKWEEEAMIHLDALGVSEKWNKRIAKELRDEIDNGLELIEEDEEVIKSQQEQITKLSEFYLANKPLPKTPSKFKILKEKAKTKFQQFKQLVTKKKTQKQELVARIEIKSN